MSPVVHIVMFGWIPAVIGLFSVMKPRHAVIASFIFAWLFLPIAHYPLPGLPDYTKMTATCWGVLIAAALFDADTLSRFRLRSLDLPMIIWCLCPMASSLANDLGLYDGLAISLRQTVTWGFPYFIGRVYFSSAEGLKELALGIFIGGMAYIPLCLYEMRFSPQLHYDLYGFYQNSFAQTRRWGGWRPMVFLDHGLMLGAWMMGASLVGLWLWQSGIVKEYRGIPMKWMVYLLMAVTVLCKSTGAIGLLAMGSMLLFATRWIKTPVLLAILVAIPLMYVPLRATGAWSGENLVSFISGNISPERAESLDYRMRNENILSDKAIQKPLFGWGTWGGARVYDEEGKDISVTDGLWIIALGNHGMVGVMAMALAILTPVFLFMRRFPAALWDHPDTGAAAVLSVLVALYMVDCLLNAMINPVYMVVAGGIVSFVAASEFVTEEESEEDPDTGDTDTFAYSPRFL